LSDEVLCLQKFQDDLFNKKFLIRIDYKATPNALIKNVQDLIFKHTFLQDGKVYYPVRILILRI